jgi:hypothetical protein
MLHLRILSPSLPTLAGIFAQSICFGRLMAGNNRLIGPVKNGGDDETRTRDLCRDRVETTSTYNNLQGL